MKPLSEMIVSVVGLGYVGLPLAVAFGKKYMTVGYDMNEKKVFMLQKGMDYTGEVDQIDLKKSSHLLFTSDPSQLSSSDFFIVAVPTPVDNAHQPDLSPLIGASKTVGKFMKKGAVVIFESTVYPGVTEDICVPLLEDASGMIWKRDFHVGYSPERINPGDKQHTLTKILKVVSADDPEILDQVANLYGSIIEAGVYRASTIKEAEAAKVIENTQRDLNIALINELAIIFDRLGIDTLNVLKAAGTKWNFLPFRPGLVGGHCIGVDPYYLTHKAESMGYHPQVILAGRRINDSMGKFIAENTVKLMMRSGMNGKGARVGILGLTFKEDCPDIRNSKVVDIVRELEDYGMEILIHDPLADPEETKQHYSLTLRKWEDLNDLAALIVTVSHKSFREKPLKEYLEKLTPQGCLIDVKSIFDPKEVQNSDVAFWRL